MQKLREHISTIKLCSQTQRKQICILARLFLMCEMLGRFQVHKKHIYQIDVSKVSARVVEEQSIAQISTNVEKVLK